MEGNNLFTRRREVDYFVLEFSSSSPTEDFASWSIWFLKSKGILNTTQYKEDRMVFNRIQKIYNLYFLAEKNHVDSFGNNDFATVIEKFSKQLGNETIFSKDEMNLALMRVADQNTKTVINGKYYKLVYKIEDPKFENGIESEIIGGVFSWKLELESNPTNKSNRPLPVRDLVPA